LYIGTTVKLNTIFKIEGCILLKKLFPLPRGSGR
jgi:hypothetical protein